MADCYRFIAEVSHGEERESAIDNAESLNKNALDLAETCLKTTKPLYLNLQLNYAVFLWEIKTRSKKEACTVAKRAYDEA